MGTVLLETCPGVSRFSGLVSGWSQACPSDQSGLSGVRMRPLLGEVGSQHDLPAQALGEYEAAIVTLGSDFRGDVSNSATRIVLYLKDVVAEAE